MPKPKLLQTVRARRVVPQIGIPETAECVVTGLVVTGVRVNVVQGFQRRVQVTPNDIGRADGFTFTGLEKEPGLPVPNELLEKLRNGGVQVNLPCSILVLQAIFHDAVTHLLGDRQRTEVV